MQAAADRVELVQFQFSPYNEKARWAMDWKGVPHTRTNLMPGPHMSVLKKLSGQTQTPVAIFGKTVVSGSANILDEIARRYPDPAWDPPESMREKARELERWFDDDITPRTRRALLMSMMDDGHYVANMFGMGKGAMTRFAYGAMFPLVRGLVKKGNGIEGPESVTDGLRAAEEAFDRVAKEAAATGYLCGNHFTRADLVAAAHLAPCVGPPHPDTDAPRPRPKAMTAFLDRFAAHPGRAWVLEIYRKHRPNRPELRRAA